MNESIFSIHDVVLIFSITECLFFIAFRIYILPFRQLTNIFLNTFLLSIAIASIGILLLYSNKFKIPLGASHGLAYFVMVCHGIRAPLLYFYVQSLTQSQFRLNAFHLLHLLPTIITIVVIANYSLTLSDLRLETFFTQVNPVVHGLWSFLKYVTLGYASAAIALVWLNYETLTQNHSNFSFPQVVWLRLLVGGFFLNWSWSLVIQFTGQFIGGITADIAGALHNYMIFVLLNALITYSLYYFLRQNKSKLAEKNTAQEIDAVNPSEIEKVKMAMEKKRLHLEANITLEEFSSRIQLPTRTVSTIINKHYGKNFFDFINGYRIEAAKSLLLDARKSNLTVLEVLTRSGFNSTSSFHRYFKRNVGLTPTEFKESQLRPKTIK